MGSTSTRLGPLLVLTYFCTCFVSGTHSTIGVRGARSFQEIVDLNAVNVAMDNKSNQRSGFWAEKVVECLAEDPTEKYEMVMCKHLVGILLVVCAKAQLVPHIQNVETVVAGVGVMGVMGNKGAVAARMKIYDSTVCFVCSHLAAHRDNVAGRNSDFHNIISKIVFANPGATLTGSP